MKKRSAVLSLFVLFAIFVVATEASGQKFYRVTSGNVAFFSSAPLENIEAYSRSLVGAMNPENKMVAFSVYISTFDFKKSLMKEHFNENYMESDKYPKATFSGTINENIDITKEGTYTVTATGKLNIHGVEQNRTISGKLVVKEGKARLESKFQVKLADHNIQIPNMVIQNIAEVVDVSVNADFALK